MRKVIVLLIVLSLLIVGCGANQKISGEVVKDTVTVFKSPTCGCCEGYAKELERQGFDVNIVPTQDMSSIKERYGIPRQMESCHTSIINGYVIEGHVPMEAVQKLLSERPDIEGIALPNMPSGTPGMPGAKRGQWRITTLSGETFMVI